MILHMRTYFMLREQFIGHSLKAVTRLIRPLQGYGNTASLSYPDTWVRKPDYLQLPYILPYSKKNRACSKLITYKNFITFSPGWCGSGD